MEIKAPRATTISNQTNPGSTLPLKRDGVHQSAPSAKPVITALTTRSNEELSCPKPRANSFDQIT